MKEETLLGIFERNRSLEAEYKGEKVFGSYRINVGKKQKVRLEWISTDSKFRQGIRINSDKDIEFSDGDKAKKVIIWEDPNIKTMDMVIKSKSGIIVVYNAWDENNSPMSGRGFAAMKVKQDKNKYTFYCNDGQPNDDFTDLIFSIELLGNDEEK